MLFPHELELRQHQLTFGYHRLDMRLLKFLIPFALFANSLAVPGPITVTGNTAVTDPSTSPLSFSFRPSFPPHHQILAMCKDSTGKYWLFCMCYVINQNNGHAANLSWVSATGVGLAIRTSTDRVAWTRIGAVWPDGTPWTDQYTGTSNG